MHAWLCCAAAVWLCTGHLHLKWSSSMPGVCAGACIAECQGQWQQRPCAIPGQQAHAAAVGGAAWQWAHAHAGVLGASEAAGRGVTQHPTLCQHGSAHQVDACGDDGSTGGCMYAWMPRGSECSDCRPCIRVGDQVTCLHSTCHAGRAAVIGQVQQSVGSAASIHFDGIRTCISLRSVHTSSTPSHWPCIDAPYRISWSWTCAASSKA